MTAFLIDSSAVYAERDRRDPEHARARAMMRSAGARFHTTDEVVWETYTLTRRRLGYEIAVAAARGLLESGVVTVHHRMAGGDDLIWATLAKFRGIGLSHVDASLIALGRRLGIDEVFSFDSDFRNVGLTTVP